MANMISHWTAVSTKKLIQMYSIYGEKLSSVSRGEKHLVWKEIALRFAQLGFYYTANSCSTKWRNLKMMYKKNKERASKCGISKVKWIYYNDMDNVIKSSIKETPDMDEVIIVSLNEVKSDDLINTNDNFEMHDHVIVKNDVNKDNTGSSKDWTDAATKCLIKLLGLYEPQFFIASQKKKDLLWNEISDKLHKNGHNYSSLVCRRKWFHLKANYFKIKEKYKKNDEFNTKWKHYQDLDKVLGAPIDKVSWSMDSVMYLIDCFNNFKNKFMQVGNSKSLYVWKKISKKMAHRGFLYSYKDCIKKWYTLKKRYKINRLYLNMNKKVTWILYDKMDSVLRDVITDKIYSDIETNNDTNNEVCKTSKLDEQQNNITIPNLCSSKTENITELKNMFKSKNSELDQMLQEMKYDFSGSIKSFIELQEKVLNELKKLNELETLKLGKLELIFSKLPNAEF